MNDLDQGNQAHERIIERNLRLQGEENQKATLIGSQSRRRTWKPYAFWGTIIAGSVAAIAFTVSNYNKPDVKIVDEIQDVVEQSSDSGIEGTVVAETSIPYEAATSDSGIGRRNLAPQEVIISQEDYVGLLKRAEISHPAKSDTVRVTERDTVRVQDYTKYIAQHPAELSQNRFSWGRLAGGWVKWSNTPLPHNASLETRAEAIANNYAVLDSFETRAPGFVKSQIGNLAILAGYSSLTCYTNRQGVLEFIPTDLDGKTSETIRYLPPEKETQ